MLKVYKMFLAVTHFAVTHFSETGVQNCPIRVLAACTFLCHKRVYNYVINSANAEVREELYIYLGMHC